MQSLKDKIPSGDASEIFNSNLITPIFNILISYLLSRKNKNIKDQKERIVNNIEVLAGLLARNEIITTDFLLTHESTDRLQIIIDKFNILIKQNLELKEENLENSAELEKVTNNFNELKAA